MSAIDVLTAAYLAGDPDEADRRRLIALLRADPAARARFARLCRDDIVLRDAVRTAPASARPASAPSRRVRRGRSRATPPSRSWGLLAAAAAALVAVALVLHQGRHGMPEAVAEVLRATGPSTVDGRQVAVRARLHRGETVVATGDLTLRLLADGSELALADGARLRLGVDDAAARLDQGRVAVRARPRAGGGLALTTPHATATVLGTVFTLVATADGTRLAVEEGLVRFAPVVGPAVAVAAGAEAGADAHGLTGAVRGFTLIDAGHDRAIGQAVLGRLAIARADLPGAGISLRVEGSPAVRALRIRAIGPDGPVVGLAALERVPPFALTGDLAGDYRPWHPTPGAYRIEVEPYTDEAGLDVAGPAAVLELTIAP